MNQQSGVAAEGSETPETKQFLWESARQEIHKQAMSERRQRQIIGWIVGIIVAVLPLGLLGLLWEFIYCRLDSIDPKMSTLITFMFSSTYIAVVALYAGILAAVFQRISGAKTDDLAPSKNKKDKNGDNS